MNFKAVPSCFNLSTLNSPLISFVTLIAYLNMIFFQLSSVMAIDVKDIEIDTGGHKIRRVLIQNLSRDEKILLQQALINHAPPEVVKKEVMPETQQTSLFSSWMGSARDWVDKGKSAVSNVASSLGSSFGLTPGETQILPYVTAASNAAVLLDPDLAEPIMVLWGSYMAAKAASSGFKRACQFAKMHYQSWFEHPSVEEEKPTVKRSPLQLDPETTKTILKASIAAGFMVAPAAGISATNLNQNLTYTEPPLFFLPNELSEAFKDYCQGLYALEDPNSGTIYSNGTSTITPSFKDGVWVVAGKCTEQVQPLVRSIAYNATTNYTKSPVKIFVSFADGVNFVKGLINIVFNLSSTPTPVPSPTTTPTPIPSPTTVPTASPTFSPTPLGPAPLDPIPAYIVGGTLIGVVTLAACTLICIGCCMKDKKKEDKERRDAFVPRSETSPLIQ